jgi:putative protease
LFCNGKQPLNPRPGHIPELLAPAGNLEKLRFAFLYGADAVYIGADSFSLRRRAGNFSLQEMAEGVVFAHERDRKVYLALNVFPHDSDLKQMETLLPHLAAIGIDAVIVSDLGTFSLVREKLPQIPIHVSTQANILNTRTVRCWEKLGAKRMVLARELTLEEIGKTGESTSAEIEVFVHGAMCMAYSGRCLMSTFLTGRDANRGDCAQPCRWEYTLIEEKRPGQDVGLIEDSGQSYIMNSKDLNLIRHLPALIEAGVDSLKIEGRMKSLYYVAAVTRIYRHALDTYSQHGDRFQFQERWWEELAKISHRDYTTGFLLGPNTPAMQKCDDSKYIRTHDFVGIVTAVIDNRHVMVQARNKISPGDRVEWIGPNMVSFHSEIQELRRPGGDILPSAKPEQPVLIQVDHPVEVNFLLRKKAL